MDRAAVVPQAPLGIAREGGSELYLPAALPKGPGPAHRASVFYNPAMALSRDLTLAVAVEESRRLGRRLEVWDALAATGVRAIRLLRETEAVARVVATDANPEVVEVLERNAVLEGSGRLIPECRDLRGGDPTLRFDLVELDPYGTPQPFLPSALRATKEGGILGVTATDMAVLAGPERATCLQRYGGRTVRGYLSREAGLRLLLAHLASVARDQGRQTRPLLSYVGGYYVRTFVRVEPAPLEGGNTGGGDGAGSTPLIPLVGPVPYEGYSGPPLPDKGPVGPMWLAPLHDPEFARSLRPPAQPGSGPKVSRFLEFAAEEVRISVPFYYETGPLSRALGLASPPPRPLILEALREQGWESCRTHASPSGWRTMAPYPEVARIVSGIRWGAAHAPEARAGPELPS